MKRVLLILFVMFLLAGSAKLERLKTLQQRQDAMERLYMLRSTEVALEIPLAGNMTWKDMLGRK